MQTPLPVIAYYQRCRSRFGKRQDIPVKAALVSSPENRLLYLNDSTSGRRFLIDTGAAVSIHPVGDLLKRTTLQPADPDQPRLVVANVTPIRTYGHRKLPVPLADTDFMVIHHRRRETIQIFRSKPSLSPPVQIKPWSNRDSAVFYHQHSSLPTSRTVSVMVFTSNTTASSVALRFLRHTITKDGIKPSLAKVQCLKDFPCPVTRHGLQRI